MYTEESLLDSAELRATLADRTHILAEVKILPLLPDGLHLTAALLADYFEINAVVLRRVVRKHAAELAGHGHRQIQGDELKQFLARNMPERGHGARTISLFTERTALVLAMLLRGSEIAERVRVGLAEEVGGAAAGSRGRRALTRIEFPHTGQPVRVVLIGDQPWFVSVDVCNILGVQNARDVRRILEPDEVQTASEWIATVERIDGGEDSAGGEGRQRNPHSLVLISESGLYTLIMKSRKPNARAFQRWVTAELLPSVRRGDADLGHHRVRMAQTLGAAVGGSVRIVAEMSRTLHKDITVMSDGTVHCPHGEMEICVPAPGEDSGPPFGPYCRCPEIERVGIRGSKGLHSCGTVKFVDVVRHVKDTEQPAAEQPADWQQASGQPRPGPTEFTARPEGSLLLTVGSAHLTGDAAQIAAVLKEMGVVLQARV